MIIANYPPHLVRTLLFRFRQLPLHLNFSRHHDSGPELSRVRHFKLGRRHIRPVWSRPMAGAPLGYSIPQLCTLDLTLRPQVERRESFLETLARPPSVASNVLLGIQEGGRPGNTTSTSSTPAYPRLVLPEVKHLRIDRIPTGLVENAES